MERYLEERAAPEMKYLDLRKPLYEERGNVVSGCLDDEIERIHMEGGDETEEEGSKGDCGGDNAAREGEEREGAASLEASSDDYEIYNVIASGQGTTTNAKDDAKDDDDEEGRMVGIPQFWVCAMGHTEAVAELITERDIDCLKHLTDVTCR